MSAENLQLKKGALAIGAQPRHKAEKKALILKTVEQAQARADQSVTAILEESAFSRATYYRWKGRDQPDQPAERVVVPRHQGLSPTPDEVAAVCKSALAHPAMGYKCLT